MNPKHTAINTITYITQSLTNLLVLRSGIFAFTEFSVFIYMPIKRKKDKNPKYDDAVFPSNGLKQMFKTKKNKNPNKQRSINLERYGVLGFLSHLKYLPPLYPLCCNTSRNLLDAKNSISAQAKDIPRYVQICALEKSSPNEVASNGNIFTYESKNSLTSHLNFSGTSIKQKCPAPFMISILLSFICLFNLFAI